MRRSFFVLTCILVSAGTIAAPAQVVYSAIARQVSITAGGTVSAFQPDWISGSWSNTYPNRYPVAEASSYPLIGVGTYVDVKLTRWVQLEAEARWQRFARYSGVSLVASDFHQDNYLAGPRVPVFHFWKASVYGKALGGFSSMTFTNPDAHGRFTTFAFGGGMDLKLTKRLSFRAVDVEYQYWPTWGNSTLKPYGVSMGVGYRVF